MQIRVKRPISLYRSKTYISGKPLKYATEDFANARDVRNLFEKIIVHQATRLYDNNNPTDEELITITGADVMAEQNASYAST